MFALVFAFAAVNGDYFTAKDITFENTAGPQGHQAVALRVSGDMAVFYNCRMSGFQDTLYTHSYRQFFRDCTISGTVDFIFGDAAVVFQNCKMIVRKPGPNQQCMVTAQGRKDHRGVGGIIIQNSIITGEPALMAANPPVKSYLGRPWKEYSRTIIMQSYIDRNIVPEGWSVWAGNYALDTCYYAEFGNRGPGASLSQRVNWRGIKRISPEEAATYTPGTFLKGDHWIRITGFPYEAGMMRV
jgi:pectinesterase